MTAPSLDLFWPKDVVGRTLGEHPFEAAHGGGCYCRGCDELVGDTSQHVMQALLRAVQRLRCNPPEATPAHQDADLVSPDPRESQIVWRGSGGDAR